MDDLKATLRKYWGYETFRPVQERVVRSLMAGRDVAVVMPTGGGKSLCYQLPAMMLGRTAVVVSPLIALMQDQAAQLKQMGVPAAVLNSSLGQDEQRKVIREARAGAYRLLYLSPERLAREDTNAWLQEVDLSFFAIDEAHCISEWGHEFRPEYRQLGRLRDRFPDVSIAAFTASATRRVRHDILAQLKLRNPEKCILSFHRPNLRYIAHKCDKGEQEKLLLNALRAHRDASVIVYAPTIARVEDMAQFLTARGFPAVPYHGKMTGAERQRNQELWMSDEVRVLVGTIAFGLGINKPSVRCVIHLSMPKSVEQYYQEAGRAGRDGLPAECVLLWQGRDVGLLAYFINQIEDAEEQRRSWQRYWEIKEFVEAEECRSLRICRHFGEQPKWVECGHCDACGIKPEWMASPARGDGTLTVASSRRVHMEGEPDPELVEYMRKWRRGLARELGTPAFIIMSDATLLDLCLKRPSNERELLRVTGIGERKAELYGAEILDALARASE